MKRFTYFFALAVALYLSGGLALAQHGHAGGAIGGVGAAAGPRSHDSAGNAGTGSSAGPQMASSQLTNNPHLNTALTNALGNLVPPGGLAAACQGYTNLGHCISAIHVANNRNLDFFCLREAMTGTALPTTDGTPCSATQTNLKLGQAIQSLDPNANAKGEAAKGTKQGNADIKSANHSQT